MKKEEVKLNEVDVKAKALGAVHVIDIIDEDKTYSLYLKEPSREIVGIYYGMKDVNPIRAAEVLLKASRIESLSDEAIFERNDLFYSAYMDVEKYLDVIKLKKRVSRAL